MKTTICILHWMPVEYFPPAINMARYFAGQDHWDISLCTNRNHLGRIDFTHPAVKIVRGTHPTGKKGIRRLLAYASFNLKAFLHLLKSKPDIVLYVEPHSALPVFLARLFHGRSQIFIHYHEYHRPEDFSQPGMRMAGWFHKLEKSRLYREAKWVSQTNETRVKFFLDDNPEVRPSKAAVLPNYPPSAWWKGENRAWSGQQPGNGPLRFVYVGALSRADTFIEQAVSWIKELGSEKATLDIFSYNLHGETRCWLRSVAANGIRFHEEGIPYDDLPQRLRDFHVGLILYKGSTLNYVHNASNKLFEYLACGLDVLYPRQMAGVAPHARCDRRPRVIECDFEDIGKFVYSVCDRHRLPAIEDRFSCESELGSLENSMLADVPILSGSN